MDINILTKRYSTPTALKALVSILFIVTFILLVAVPVFELIPQDQYINVFNLQGVPSGSYESTSYTVFTMLQNDYGYPVLSVDRPYNIASSSGQMRTRVQAFVESIEIKTIQRGGKA